MKDREFTTMRVTDTQAAMFIVFALQQGNKVQAVQFVKNWCGCNLRSALNMVESFEQSGGSNSKRIDKIAAILPLGKLAEVI